MPQPLNPLHLPVRTAGGQALGVVVGLEIDPGSQQIITYHVKPSRLLPDLVRSPLMIRSSQVIDITPQGIVVDDAAVSQAGPVPEPT